MGLLDFLKRKKSGGTDETWRLEHVPSFEAGGITFRWKNDDGRDAPFYDSDAGGSAKGRDRLLAADLQLLADEGLMVDGTVPFEVIARFEDEDMQRLGFEVSRGWAAEARPRNAVGRLNPDVTIHWKTPEGAFFAGTESERFAAVECGFWDNETSQLHILPRPLVRIRTLVASQPGRFSKLGEEYKFLADVQTLAEEGTDLSELGSLKLDDQLSHETYVVPTPEDVKVDVRKTADGGLALSPTMPGHESFEAAQELLKRRPASSSFRQTGPDGHGRERIAYDDAVLQRIDVVRAVSSVNADDVPEFARDPGRFIADRAGQADPRLREIADEMDFESTTQTLVDLDLTSYGPRVSGEEAYVAGPSYEQRPLESDLEGSLLGEMGRPQRRQSDEDGEHEARPPASILAVEDNLEEMRFAAQASEALRQQLPQFPTPSTFRGQLQPHQSEGYIWLRNLWSAAESEELGQGGILADEMGLGKTVQVAALLAYLRQERQIRPTAVVAPATVTQNWPGELRKFVGPELRILDHAGSSRSKDPRVIAGSDVVIVTYDTLVRDQHIFARIPFQALVLDEAHYIKNQGVKRSRASRAMQAKLRLALTATPVENRLEELWAITEFAQPGLLGTLTSFKSSTVQPIEEASSGASAAATQLLETLGPHYLRRTKDQVADLPPKRVTTVELPMSGLQREVYRAVRGYHQQAGKGALAAIHDLVRASAHPAAVAELGEQLELGSQIDSLLASPEEFIAASPKFAFIAEKLREIHQKGEKAVIFTSVRAVQPLVQMMVEDLFGFRPVALNGATTAKSRFREISNFNETPGFDVLVVSAKAAGLGVNITSANHVFHLTREWNPSKENQATDRVHRIGQDREVNVWVPICVDPSFLCVDERIREVMDLKAGLAHAVIRPSADLSFSENDLAVCVADMSREEAQAEAARRDGVQIEERQTMRLVLQQPVEQVEVELESAPHDTAPEPAVSKPPRKTARSGDEALARSILEHPKLAPRLAEKKLNTERDLLLLTALLSRRRIHANELAREVSISAFRLRGRLRTLKAQLNVPGAVLNAQDDYYHLSIDALERHYGLSYATLGL